MELLSTLDLCLKLSCVHFFVILIQLTYKCFRLLSDYRSFVMFLHNRVIHTSPVVPKCNEHYFTDQKWLPLIKLTYTCLERPVLGQWLNFSQCLCVFYRLFSQFCTYTIFWRVIKMYSNTNLHMHREPTKYIFFYEVVFLELLSTLDLCLKLSCVHFFCNFKTVYIQVFQTTVRL